MIDTASAAGLLTGLEIGRDQAREDAVRELTDARYAADDPNLLQRALNWLGDRITDLLDRAASVTPGGAVGVIVVALVVVVLLVALWFGGRAALRERAARTAPPPLFDGSRALTAAEHRARAGAADSRDDYATALREWFRAAVRGLEERGLLDPRPGRTADEAAVEIGQLFPATLHDSDSAARRFDAVAFGDEVATADDARLARSLDESLSRSVPTLARA